MTKRTKLLAGLAILLIFSLILAGCNDKAVATVNGEKITETALNEQLEIFSKQNGIDLKDPQFEAMADPFKKQVLDQMVRTSIVLQEAEKRKIKVSKKDVDAEIDKIVKDYFQGDKKKFDEAVKQMGMNEQFLRVDIETGLTSSKLIEQIVKEAKISEADIKKYYDQNKEQLTQVEASHILLEKEDEAKGIIEKLKAVPTDKFAEEFAKLAQESSTDDSNKNNGGKLGFFGKGQMVPEFEGVAFALEVGKFSLEPVKTDFGYHVIYVTNKKDKFEDVKAEIKQNLENEEVNKYIANLTEKAKVDYKITFKETPPAGTGGSLPPATGGASGQNPHETGEIPLDEDKDNASDSKK